MEAKEFNRLIKTAYKDEKAVEILYRFYYPRIIAKFKGRYGEELAKDSAQDFFLKIVSSKWESDYIEKPTSYVFACCENIILKRLNNDKKYIPIDENVACFSDFDSVESNIFDCFDEQTKKIMTLIYVYGFSLKETAEMVGMSYVALRKKHSRLIKKLKGDIGNDK